MKTGTFSILMFYVFTVMPLPSLASVADESWHFRVKLDDTEIGHHTFRLEHNDDKTHVSVEADFNVKFLFFNAYTYKHRNYEIWSGKCLDSITSKTNDNGEHSYLQGNNLGESIRIETQKGTRQLPGCVKTFSYWDPDFLSSKQLLNAQTGELMPVNIQQLGQARIQVRGASVVAEHYRVVTDEFSIELWYSVADKEWLALQSTTSDGAVLTYEKI